MAQRRRPKRNPLLNPLAWYQKSGELFPLVRTTPVTDPCRLSAAASGTYQVNPDCTGSSTIDIPGLPFSIETALPEPAGTSRTDLPPAGPLSML